MRRTSGCALLPWWSFFIKSTRESHSSVHPNEWQHVIPEESRLLTSPKLLFKGPLRYAVTTKPYLLTFVKIRTAMSLSGLMAKGYWLRSGPDGPWMHSGYALLASSVVYRVQVPLSLIFLWGRSMQKTLWPIGLSLFKYKLMYLGKSPLFENPSCWGKSVMTVALGFPENSNIPRERLKICHINPNCKKDEGILEILNKKLTCPMELGAPGWKHLFLTFLNTGRGLYILF